MRAILILISFTFLFAACNSSSDQRPDFEAVTPDTSEITWSMDSEFEEKVSAYEDENRHIWQKPDRVIDLLGDIQNKTVVDLGAGTGYFAFRLISKAGKVIAIDIDEQFIDFMIEKKKLLPLNHQERFEIRLATTDDPKLDPGEANAVLVVNTYVYIENRQDYFRNLRMFMSPGAKLVIIEFKMKDLPEGPPPEEKLSLSTVEQELKEAGYVQISSDDQTLDYQYIITAINP
jgi:ubiquinone/menaquinone biosynthesis C-methylase UbiE